MHVTLTWSLQSALGLIRLHWEFRRGLFLGSCPLMWPIYCRQHWEISLQTLTKMHVTDGDIPPRESRVLTGIQRWDEGSGLISAVSWTWGSVWR